VAVPERNREDGLRASLADLWRQQISNERAHCSGPVEGRLHAERRHYTRTEEWVHESRPGIGGEESHDPESLLNSSRPPGPFNPSAATNGLGRGLASCGVEKSVEGGCAEPRTDQAQRVAPSPYGSANDERRGSQSKTQRVSRLRPRSQRKHRGGSRVSAGVEELITAGAGQQGAAGSSLERRNEEIRVRRQAEPVAHERTGCNRADAVELVRDVALDPVAEREIRDDELLPAGLIGRRGFREPMSKRNRQREPLSPCHRCRQRKHGRRIPPTREGNEAGRGSECRKDGCFKLAAR